MASVEDLIKEKTDFMIAYKTNEPFALQSKGYKEEDYNIYSAEDLGMKLYADILFTSKRELQDNPNRVKNFVDASMKGWEVAFDDINKTAKFIYENYNEHNKSIEALIFEGNELRKMAIKRDNSLGNISALRLKKMEQYYFDRGFIDHNLSLNEYEEFIYKEWYEKNKKKIENIVLLLILALVVFFLISLIYLNYLLKKKVKEGIEKYQEQEKLRIQETKKLKKLEKQKIMGINITNATHQLKSPLNSIAAIINNLRRDKEANNFNNQVLDTALAKIEKKSFSMRETVDYFLELTDTTKLEALSVNRILAESVESFDTLFSKSNIKVIVNIDEYQDFRCFGNKNQLSQVFHIIFDNAIEVLTERTDKRRITVSIKENGDDFVDIVIADNGRGIPKGIIKRIFNFGFSSTKSTKNNKGVGLSIAKELIEDELDGKIMVDNNDGAVFTIRLPLY